MRFILKNDPIGHNTVARCLTLIASALLISLAPKAQSQLINFDTEPSLPAQPNNFNAAGPMQTYTKAGVYSISGGVVLGNPSFLASFAANGSPPNLYGTTDIADPSLQSTITLTIDLSLKAISVAGVLFNGQTFAEDYTLTAFSGVTQVSSQTFMGVQDNSSANGFRDFLLSAPSITPITELTITTPNAGVNGWDFLVDDLNITRAQISSVPDSSSPLLLPGALLLLGFLFYRRRTNRATC